MNVIWTRLGIGYSTILRQCQCLQLVATKLLLDDRFTYVIATSDHAAFSGTLRDTQRCERNDTECSDRTTGGNG
jgi:hypothetical protein